MTWPALPPLGAPPGVVLGLGADLCDIRRIEAALARFGERFALRVFTAEERARAERRSGHARAGAYAKRFAAKEAAAKALGTGFAAGVRMADLGVVNLPGGQPTLAFAGAAARRLATLAPPGWSVRANLTLADEYPYAFALVLLSASPPGL